ncbi:hypothetical protein DMC25_02530 [Caulobacter sp. D4A]|nr:hypothetical protein DMC18_14325 [Caulobacter sp. D5]PXA94334.1 hypothetical protein DMC25_02530 [Caulobacter sp. D4A]
MWAGKPLAALALAGLTAAASWSPAAASTAEYGKVTAFIQTGSTVMFYTSGTRSTAPSCQGADVPARWAIDVSTPAGQSMLSILLTAYSTQRTVKILGTGTCSVQGDTETVFLLATDGV